LRSHPALLAAELLGLLTASFPTLGDMPEFLMRSRVGRWTILLGWERLGRHLFVR
jgi:hypothetical protein